jgi:hypothetical protein
VGLVTFPTTPVGLTVELDALAGVLLTEDFEGATPTDNFDATSAVVPTVQASSLRNGTMGVELAPAASTSYLRWRERLWRDGAASYPYWSVRFYVRLPSLPSAPPPSIFACITVAGVDDFTFFYNTTTGLWKWDLDQNDAASGPEVVADQWYLVEAKGSYASDTWTADVRINGIEYDRITTIGNGAEVVHNGLWGTSGTAQTWTADLDDFAMAVSDYPLGFLGPPTGTRVWSDITALVYGRDDLTIRRGRSDEATEVDPSVCTLTANNRSGDLSARNPVGAFYGQLGRNTPMRVRLDDTLPKYLLLGGAYGSNASASPPQTEAGTDDSAALSVTGDIDIRIDIQPDHWDWYDQGLCNQYLTVGDERAWVLWLRSDGTLTFTWSDDGTSAGLISETSTVAVTVPASGRLALRVTVDVDNGAGGYDVDFYTASDIDGSWTQLGATVTGGSTTSIHDSSAQVEIGRAHTATVAGNTGGVDLRGRVYAFELYDGIAGDLVAGVRFDTMTEPGETSFVDQLDNEWALDGDTSIVDPAVRFYGEVAEWPVRRDVSGNDVYVPVQAAGVLRRLQQGSSPLKSTMLRGYTSASFTPRAYWPCEDADGATQIASGLPDGIPMTFQAATPSLAADTHFACSNPLPTFSGSQWTGTVPGYPSTGKVQVWFLMYSPGGDPDAQGVCSVYTTGTVHEWRLLYDSTTGFTFEAYTKAGTQLFSNSAIGFDVDGMLLRVDIELQQNGADVDWDVAILEVGQSVGYVSSGTEAGRTIGRAQTVVMNAGGDHDSIVVGHISVHDEVRSLFDLYQELNAYAGELAGARISRLCSEAGLTFRGLGDQDATVALGPQTPAKLVDLLREAANADGGILYEPRDLLGLAYRPRESLYLQEARLALDYDDAPLSDLEPVDDDQHVRNDITVTRVGGSSARAEETSGPLSTQDPPDGVGRYDDAVSISVQADSQLPDQAGWRLHLGTVDQARYPTLKVDLARQVFVTDAALGRSAEDLDIGDRITVDNPPVDLPPDQISQLIQGMTEVLSNFTHTLEANCSPEWPYAQVGRYNDGEARYSSDGSTLDEDLTSAETSVDVATATGPLWSHADGDFDIVIGGERMTVTAISGSSSPQTFTVTRSVNGIVKDHRSGATVELYRPVVYVI